MAPAELRDRPGFNPRQNSELSPKICRPALGTAVPGVQSPAPSVTSGESGDGGGCRSGASSTLFKLGALK